MSLMTRAATAFRPSSRDFYATIEGQIPEGVRVAIFLYIIVYRILTPVISSIIVGDQVAYMVLRVMTTTLVELTIAAPILFFRRIGYFHPLAFPFFYGLAFDLAFQPLHIFMPFISPTRPIFEISPSRAIFLRNLNDVDYSIYTCQLQIATVLFYIFTYIGYYLYKRRSRHPFRLISSQALIVSAFGYICVALLAGWTFILIRGGIQQQILAFYEGRFTTMSGLGIFTVPTKVGSVALLLWMAAAEKAERTIPFYSWPPFYCRSTGWSTARAARSPCS